jgi:hypothetical protein
MTLTPVQIQLIGEVYFEWDYFENGDFEFYFEIAMSKKFHGYFKFNFENGYFEKVVRN